MWTYIGIWLVGVIAVVISARKCREAFARPRGAFLGYLGGACVPALLTGVWLFSGPYLHRGSLELFAASCLLPLTLCALWNPVFQPHAIRASRIELALPPISVLAAIVAFGAATQWLFGRDPFRGGLAVTSPDRSYWYISRLLRPDGTNAANSYGFLGPEPAKVPEATRILLIGDSIPAAGRPVNFVDVAEKLHARATGRRIELLNASVPAFSLEQIRNYYSDKLRGLPHDALIVSFYLDDINRELRYRKNNYLYTPSWPEWMQDVYYSCWLCRSLLGLRRFSENTFLWYRTKSYADSFPRALGILSDIQHIAKERGARLAVINVPRFNWPSVLADPAGYEFAHFHRQVERWCRDRNVAYLDLLPALASRDIRDLRISDADLHFNDDGHRLVGEKLAEFIVPLAVTHGVRYPLHEGTASPRGLQPRLPR
jgi:hypothetical protein